MRNQKDHHSTGQPHGLPSFFAAFKPLRPAHRARILKHKNRGLEADLVLGSIKPIFSLVPDKAHLRKGARNTVHTKLYIPTGEFAIGESLGEVEQ